MFTKEQYESWLKQPHDISINKEMIEEFPFLLPRNRWTGKVSEDFDYSYNELFAMPDGWKRAFGYEMICEIKEVLEKHEFLYDYRITDIKEKYGGLRWYSMGAPEELHQVISKYEELSYNVCLICGKPVEYFTRGYIMYLCADCAKNTYNGDEIYPISELEEDNEEGEEE